MPRTVPPVLPAGTLAGRRQPALILPDGFELRPWLDRDADALAAAFGDPAIQHWHHRTMSPDEASVWIDATSVSWERETDAEWAVTEHDEVVGRVALRGIDLRIGQAQVSYWTVPGERGRGIARRAVARVAGWSLEEIGFWRLEIRHSVRNDASCRVAEIAGFRREARLERAHIHDDGWHDVHIHTRFRR